MQFVRPQPFAEAAAKLGRKSTIASQLTSEQWSRVPIALRERGFWSARVESVRLLQRGRNSIADFLNVALDSDTGALKTGSRADFIKQLQDFALANGLGSVDPDGQVPDDITNIASERRLGLFFDTQTRQAQDYGYAKQGWDPDILEAFPAQRFIRVRPVKESRNMHQHHEGEVRLKSDLAFWIGLNRDFEVPWGPWGWGCGHEVEDVDRAEAERLGLIKPGQSVRPIEQDFNQRLESSVQNLDPAMQQSLKRIFGDQVEITQGTARWTGAPAMPAQTPRTDPAPPAPAVRTDPASPPQPEPDRPAVRRLVSEALTIVRRDPEPMHVAKHLIDLVHDDGVLPRIPVDGSVPSDANGVLELDLHRRAPIRIGVRKTAHEHITLFHEVGHLIDHQALGTKGELASKAYHPDLEDWRQTVRQSSALKQIAAAAQDRYTRYLLQLHEVWARSYAQWITKRSLANPSVPEPVRKSLAAGLADYLSRPFQGGHWTDEDFAPISDSIERLFQKKGWLRTPPENTLP